MRRIWRIIIKKGFHSISDIYRATLYQCDHKFKELIESCNYYEIALNDGVGTRYKIVAS